jgi:hypothetical protein
VLEVVRGDTVQRKEFFCQKTIPGQAVGTLSAQIASRSVGAFNSSDTGPRILVGRRSFQTGPQFHHVIRHEHGAGIVFHHTSVSRRAVAAAI